MMSLRKLDTAGLAAEQSEMCGTCSLTDLASPCVFHRSSWKAEGGGCGAQGITSLSSYIRFSARSLSLGSSACSHVELGWRPAPNLQCEFGQYLTFYRYQLSKYHTELEVLAIWPGTYFFLCFFKGRPVLCTPSRFLICSE